MNMQELHQLIFIRVHPNCTVHKGYPTFLPCKILHIALFMLSLMPAATSNADLLVDGLQPGGPLCTFQPGAKEQ